MESDGGERESEDHAGCGPDHDPAPANDVDVLERDEREDEVRAGDDEADGGRLVEPDLLEERRWGSCQTGCAESGGARYPPL